MTPPKNPLVCTHVDSYMFNTLHPPRMYLDVEYRLVHVFDNSRHICLFTRTKNNNINKLVSPTKRNFNF